MTDDDKIQYVLIAILRHFSRPILIDMKWLDESIHAKGELKVERAPGKEAILVSFTPCTVEEFAEKYGIEKLGPVSQAEFFIGRKKEKDNG